MNMIQIPERAESTLAEPKVSYAICVDLGPEVVCTMCGLRVCFCEKRLVMFGLIPMSMFVRHLENKHVN